MMGRSRNMTDNSGLYPSSKDTFDEGYRPEVSVIYPVVLGLFLCYYYLSDSTLRTSIFAQFLLYTMFKNQTELQRTRRNVLWDFEFIYDSCMTN